MWLGKRADCTVRAWERESVRGQERTRETLDPNDTLDICATSTNTLANTRFYSVSPPTFHRPHRPLERLGEWCHLVQVSSFWSIHKRLMNALVPGSIPTFDPSPANVFAQVPRPNWHVKSQMENAASFLAAAKSLGIPDSDLFQPLDLSHPPAHHRVLITLLALQRRVSHAPSRASSARTLYTQAAEGTQSCITDLLEAFKPPTIPHHHLAPFVNHDSIILWIETWKMHWKGTIRFCLHVRSVISSSAHSIPKQEKPSPSSVFQKRVLTRLIWSNSWYALFAHALERSFTSAIHYTSLYRQVSRLQERTRLPQHHHGVSLCSELIFCRYMENGSLATLIKSFGPCSEHLSATYTSRMLKGLAYLHQQGIVHCDLKAANVLTTKDGQARLSDFGVSKRILGTVRETVGSPYFMAPEVIQSGDVTPASDIWSLGLSFWIRNSFQGCTVIELVTGSPPYSDLIPVTALFRIVTGMRFLYLIFFRWTTASARGPVSRNNCHAKLTFFSISWIFSTNALPRIPHRDGQLPYCQVIPGSSIISCVLEKTDTSRNRKPRFNGTKNWRIANLLNPSSRSKRINIADGLHKIHLLPILWISQSLPDLPPSIAHKKAQGFVPKPWTWSSIVVDYPSVSFFHTFSTAVF